MFNETSGSMYEELENKRLKKIRRRKIIIKRIITIMILLLIIIYLVLLLIDIRRFRNGENPLIITNTSIKEYDDGTVKSYYSIGWVFRYYDRETIKESEIAPFFSKIKMDNELIRKVDYDLPQVDTNYSVPKNESFNEKVDGVLFFYKNVYDNYALEYNYELLGTYKCILSESDCEITYSNPLDDDYRETKMGILHDRYVFITEYKNKDSKAEEKHIYLYDIVAKHLIAEYQDVRFSTTSDANKRKSILGYDDSYRIIVKQNNYWGIDVIDKGNTKNFLDYKYRYVGFDQKNLVYILQDEDKKWLAYDTKNDKFTEPKKEKIESLYVKNDKMYIVTFTKEEKTGKKNYILFNQDGENVLTKENIDNLDIYDSFICYINDENLHLIDFDGKELIEPIKLYFTSLYSSVKPYNVKFIGDLLIISTPKDRNTTHFTDEYHFDKTSYELKNTRKDVKETTN